ncbi:MAG: trigger factor [Clostridia bacterium]|nr:trigger factor [Clostridia bacterium]
MSYTYEKVSGNKAKLTFTVPAEQFDEALQKAFLKVRGRINVPGFRRGKAPRRMIETLYGESVFYDEALDAIFPDVYREAVKELDLHPVDQPEVEMDEIGAGKDLKFHLEVFVRPDVTLGDYKGLEVEVAQQKVTDEMIDARIAQDQEKVSRTVDVEDRPVQNGDTVNLNYAGTVDGVAFDGGTAENQTLTIGSNQFIPGFEEQMIGMNIGEEKDLNVTFPAQYHAENLAGKDAVFHVKVNSIQATEKPALDDDFAADVSEFNTFAEYRENVVKELTKQVEESNANAIENAVMEKAVANAQMDVPAAMIDDQVDYMIQDMEMNMRYQGLKMEDFLKYTGQTLDAMKLSYRGEAERRVKTELVMEAIRKAEGAEPTEEEIEAEIKRQAESMGRDAEDFKKSLTDSQKDYLKDNAEIRKALKVMRESAKVSEPKPAEEPKAEEAADTSKDEPKQPARRRTTKKTEKPAEEAEA